MDGACWATGPALCYRTSVVHIKAYSMDMRPLWFGRNMYHDWYPHCTFVFLFVLIHSNGISIHFSFLHRSLRSSLRSLYLCLVSITLGSVGTRQCVSITWRQLHITSPQTRMWPSTTMVRAHMRWLGLYKVRDPTEMRAKIGTWRSKLSVPYEHR